MKKKILLTRPRASSEHWASFLASHGFECVIEPLLVIEPTGARRPASSFKAIVLTSANAIDALEEIKEPINDLLGLPCFCVGPVTGEAARDYGFTNIYAGASDSAALAHLIMTSVGKKDLPLLHIAGDVVDTKIQDVLAASGFTLIPWVIYHAKAVDDLTHTTRASFAAGEFTHLPIFSPRSARILVALLEKNRLTYACHTVIAVGLSQAVANVLQTLPWRHLRIAATPSAEDVLVSLQTESSMTQTPLPPLIATPASEKRGKNYTLWVLLGMILLSAAGSVALVNCPWIHASLVPVSQAPAENIIVLQKRLDALEARINALTEITAAAPQTSSNEDTLAEAVKTLQMQMADIQNQGSQNQQVSRQLVATAFAFWDLREAATNGHPFAAQLAALHMASNDPAVNAQAIKLQPYAALSTPTMAQLKEELISTEATMSLPPIPTSDNPTLSNRLKAALQTLVSVHPLHNPQFADLEQAVDSGDSQAAYDAFRFLPDDTQRKMSAWQAKLTARLAIDNALHILATTFVMPSSEGTAP